MTIATNIEKKIFVSKSGNFIEATFVNGKLKLDRSTGSLDVLNDWLNPAPFKRNFNMVAAYAFWDNFNTKLYLNTLIEKALRK